MLRLDAVGRGLRLEGAEVVVGRDVEADPDALAVAAFAQHNRNVLAKIASVHAKLLSKAAVAPFDHSGGGLFDGQRRYQ